MGSIDPWCVGEPLVVIRVPRPRRTMAWAGHQVIGDWRPQAVRELLHNPRSYAKAESLRSEVGCELKCHVTMLQVIHVQLPPSGV